LVKLRRFASVGNPVFMTQRPHKKKERDALLHDLEERVKELQLHHEATQILQQDDLPLDRAVQEVVALIPPGMEQPECAEAKITLGRIEAATPGYRECPNRLSVSFPLCGGNEGSIDVVYVRKSSVGDVAFLREERSVLESLAAMLRISHDRRWTEKERARSETMLRIAGRVARIGGWTIELPGRELSWSDEVRMIHEVGPGEQPTLEEAIRFYPEEYRAEVGRIVKSCINEGRPFQFEMELITARGRRIPVMAIGEAVRNEGGEITRLQGAFQDLSELRAAEATAEANERRFRQLAESMPMVVWTADASGNIDYANRRLFETTEAQRSEDPNTRWQRFVHPDDLAPALEEWERCVREESPFSTQYRILHRRDNAYHWFQIRAQPIRDPDGTVSHWFGTGMDVHDTKILEEKATRLADRLSRTLESITDGFFTLDREWRFTFINTEMERFLDMGRDRLLGKVLWDEFPELIGTPFESAYRKAEAEKITVRLEEYYDPLERWLSLRIYPSDDRLSVFFQDITKRKKDEEQMRLLAASIASLNDIVLITKAEPLDEPGPEIVFVNEAFEHLTGYAASEVIGRNPRFLQGPETDREALGRLRKALRAGQPSLEEVINYGKDGQKYRLEINLQPVRDKEGKVTHFVAVQRDVTERRKQERELVDAKLRAEAANQVKSDFMAVMSHELRTPLNPILGFTEMLISETENEETRSLLEIVHQAGSNLLETIEGILDFANVNDGRIELVEEPFSPYDLIDRKIKLTRDRLGDSGVAITSMINSHVAGGEKVKLIGDVDKIRRILRHFLSNAVKFTKKGEIRLEADIKPGENGDVVAEFRVSDTGLGIEKKDFEKLFLPFTQVDSSITREYGGTGIGLSICKYLADLMGGEISVESDMGRGSTFSFRAPYKLAEDSGTTARRERKKMERTPENIDRNPEVLVAEDNEPNVMFVSRLLKDMGCRVTVKRTGGDASEYLDHNRPDLLLLDLHMPGIHGLDILGRLRESEGAKPVSERLPVIVLTADAADDVEEKCIEAGANGFLLKPIIIDQFKTLLTTHLPRNRRSTFQAR